MGIFLLSMFFIGEVFARSGSYPGDNTQTYDCTLNTTAIYCTPPGSSYTYFYCSLSSGCSFSEPEYYCKGSDSHCTESGVDYIIGWINGESECEHDCQYVGRCSGDTSRPCAVDDDCIVCTSHDYGSCDFGCGTRYCSPLYTEPCTDESDCDRGACEYTDFCCSNNHNKSCTSSSDCEYCAGTTNYGTCDYAYREVSADYKKTVNLGCCGSTPSCTGCSCTPDSCSGDYPLESCPMDDIDDCTKTTHTCDKEDSCENPCTDTDGSTTESRTCYSCVDELCDPITQCAGLGYTSSPTDYPLIDIVNCNESINCETETKYGTCYETPSSGDQSVQVTIGSNISGSIPCHRHMSRLEKLWKELIGRVYAYTTETDLGFVNDSASGLKLNNPVPVEVIYSDTDGVNDIEALYYWMSKEGTTPTKPPQFLDEIGNSPQTESDESFGFMVRRTGDDWTNADVYVPEIVETDNYWVPVGTWGEDFFIYGPNELPMVRIVNGDISVPSSDDIELSFDLEFIKEGLGSEDLETVYEGTYDVLAMFNDEFGFTPRDNEPPNPTYGVYEIREYDNWTDTDLNWLVDLTKPAVDSLVVEVTGDTELGISWRVSDDESGIANVVGNVYRDGNGQETLVYLEEDPKEDREYIIPSLADSVVGYINDGFLWVLGESTSSQSGVYNVDISGINDGSLDFYITVIDKAGNDKSLGNSFSVGPWMISKGGLLYSTGGTNVAVRLLDLGGGEEWSDTLWHSPSQEAIPDVEVFDSTLADLSTEVLSGNVDVLGGLYNLVHSVPIEEGGVYNKSTMVLQNSGIARNNIYQVFKSRVEGQLSTIGAETITDTVFDVRASDYCSSEYCVVKTEENITINSGFVCDTRVLFLTSGNITIEPNITNDGSTDGCIFVSGGNITIEEGDYASSGNLEPLYDIVEGFFLADGTILIEAGDAGQEVKDGLQINGGLVGFGGDTQSIIVERTMRLVYKVKYPTLAIHTDARYGKIALQFFGPERSVYKQEVGFKPF